MLRTHLDGIDPCHRRFRHVSKNGNFASCYNACSTTNSRKSKETSFPVVWDSGASVCITHDRDDFINFTPNSNLRRFNSVGGGHDVNGEGEVLWSVAYTTGMLRHLKLKAYYVPSSRGRLLSINALLERYNNENDYMRPELSDFKWC